MKNYLFIGGGQDGTLLALPSEQREIRFPVYTPPKAVLIGDLDELPMRSSQHRVESYFLDHIRAKEYYYIYRHESLTLDDVFEKLLAGYKPEPSKV